MVGLDDGTAAASLQCTLIAALASSFWALRSAAVKAVSGLPSLSVSVPTGPSPSSRARLPRAVVHWLLAAGASAAFSAATDAAPLSAIVRFL